MKGLLKRAADWGNRTHSRGVACSHLLGKWRRGLSKAFALHQAGRLPDAADAYGAIVAADESHFDACHMLGVVRFQQGRYADAVSMLQRAVELNPSSGAAHANHGAALRAAGNPVAAESAFERAARLVPDWSLPVKNLGSIRLERGDADAAIAAFRRASEIDPRDVDAFLDLGTSLLSIGDLGGSGDRASTRGRLLAGSRAGALLPGQCARARGDTASAEQCFREALSLEPRLAEASNNLGAILQRAGDLARAEHCFRDALAARPAFNAARANLATTLRQLGRLDEAQGECLHVLRASPADADALNALALILSERGEWESAKRCLRQIVSSPSPTAAAHVNLGNLLNRTGDAEGAERSYRAALALDPGNSTAAYNLATLSLMHGRFAEGLRLYERRFDCFAGEMLDSAGLHRQLDQSRRWHGEPLNGRRLLVWTEQGLGDAVMMMRYLPLLPERGASRIVVQCQPPLARCMHNMACVDDVVVTAAPAETASYDVHVPIMSLPSAGRHRAVARFGATAVPGRADARRRRMVQSYRTARSAPRRNRLGRKQGAS